MPSMQPWQPATCKSSPIHSCVDWVVGERRRCMTHRPVASSTSVSGPGSVRECRRTCGSTTSRDSPTSGVFALFADRRNMIGYRSIMTPGTVAGFDAIHRRYATRPMADLLRPSIEMSRSGYSMPEYVTSRGHQPSLPGMPHPRDKYASTPAARVSSTTSTEKSSAPESRMPIRTRRRLWSASPSSGPMTSIAVSWRM